MENQSSKRAPCSRRRKHVDTRNGHAALTPERGTGARFGSMPSFESCFRMLAADCGGGSPTTTLAFPSAGAASPRWALDSDSESAHSAPGSSCGRTGGPDEISARGKPASAADDATLRDWLGEAPEMMGMAPQVARRMVLRRKDGRQETRKDGRQEMRKDGRQETRKDGRQETRKEGRKEGRSGRLNVEGTSQFEVSLMQQWFHDAPNGLIPPTFTVNAVNEVNVDSQAASSTCSVANAVNAFNQAFNLNPRRSAQRVHPVNAYNGVNGVNAVSGLQVNPVNPTARTTAAAEPAAEPAAAALCVSSGPESSLNVSARFRSSQRAAASDKPRNTAAESGKAHAGKVEAGKVEAGKVEAGKVEAASVLNRPGADIRREWMVLKGEVGSGQYGTIRRCVHRSTGEHAACKSIKKAALQRGADVAAVRNEVAFMEELKGHPNIVEIKQAAETHKHVHIVMEICEGGDLFDHIYRHRRLSEHSAARIFRSLVLALQHCHSHGIVHRDIKPENVLLTNPANNEYKGAAYENGIKLIDFGVAARYTPGVPLTDMVGTPAFMAPEVFSGSYGPECDVWSAGITLFMMLCGSFPFKANSHATGSSSSSSGSGGGSGSDAAWPKVLEAKRRGFSHSRRWQDFSSSAKHLIIHMLSADPSSRITLKEILEHEWIKAKGF